MMKVAWLNGQQFHWHWTWETDHDPAAHHPRAMLLQLQFLDIVIPQTQTSDEHDVCQSTSSLYLDRARKGISQNHEDARRTDKSEQQDDVAANSMDYQKFVSDYGHKLEHDENGSRQNGAEV